MSLIAENKSLLVVGNPRACTSHTMRVLEFLGVPVKFVEPPAERAAQIREKNPYGYYEGPWTGRGLSNPKANVGGHAIKVLSRPALPPKTDYTLVQAVILCTRCPKDQLESESNLHFPVRRTPKRWLRNFAPYAAWLSESDVPHITVDYDEWPDGTAVDKIIAFLQIDQADATGAKALYDASLRHDDAPAWSDGESVDGAQCDAFYAALQVGDQATMRSIANDQAQAAALAREQDTTFWVDVDPSLAGLTHRELFHGTWSMTNHEQQLLFNRRPDQRAKLKSLHNTGVKYGQNNCSHFAIADQVDQVQIFNGDYKLSVMMPRVACSACQADVSMANCFTCWHRSARMGHEPTIGQVRGEVAI